MPNYTAPGTYMEEVLSGARPIQAVGTSTVGFIGQAPDVNARLDEAVAINNWSEFIRDFAPKGSSSTHLSHAVHGFFLNGGSRCYVVNVGEGSISGGGHDRKGVDLLEQYDEIAIVAAPGYTDAASYDAVIGHCERMRDRVGILDAPLEVPNLAQLTQVATENATVKGGAKKEEDAAESENVSLVGLGPQKSKGGYAAFYFPWITVRDQLSSSSTDFVNVPPSGHLAGVWARSDATRGVHKAPANESIRGALNLSYRLTQAEAGELNQNGVNGIRIFSGEGIRVWGARTIADSSEWRYINVRRLINMIKESIAESTRWIVFEPNDRPLWQAIRRDVNAFLTQQWIDGALMGATAEEAFYVKCDEETNPVANIDAGIVVTEIGIRPTKPAEFVVFRFSQQESGAEIDLQ